MAKEYDNSNSGALFRNDKYQEPKDGEYTGPGEINCPNCRCRITLHMRAWVKSAKETSRKFFRILFGVQADAGAAAPPAEQVACDVPF